MNSLEDTQSDKDTNPDPGTVTSLLLKASAGDEQAINTLFSLVYPYLRRKAFFELNKEKPGHTFQATDLVHEAYIRLVNKDKVSAQNRTHFFAICGKSMRRILVDHARSKNAQKRGGKMKFIKIEDLLEEPGAPDSHTVLLLDLALERLQEIDPFRVKLVEMRLFAGLTLEEMATALDVSYSKVQRAWKITQVWLEDFLETRS